MTLKEIKELDADEFELLESGMLRLEAERHMIDMNKLDYAHNMKDANRSKFFNAFKSSAFPSYLDPILSMDEMATKLGEINGR